MLDLVSLLSNSQADQTTSSVFYDELSLDLAQLPLIVQATPAAVTIDGSAPDNSVALPTNVVVPIQYFWNDTHLPEARENELVTWNQNWRIMHGMPLVIFRPDIGSRRIRTVPLPDQSTGDISTADLAEKWPSDAVMIIHTAVPICWPEWFNLPLAWLILAKEFARESDHTDMAFSQVANVIGETLLEMVS